MTARGHPPMLRHNTRGFTLLELLVALAIFALLAAIAYGGLQRVLATRAQTDRAAQRLQALQNAWMLMQRDIEQTVARPVRGNYGSSQPGMAGAGPSQYPLVLTRGGVANPLHRQRSSLQRVAYRVRGSQLVRTTWPVLDRAPDTAPRDTVILGQVQSLALRFLDAQRQWQANWPPLLADGSIDPRPPLAVEVTLDLDRWGRVRWIFPVRGG